MSNFHSNGILVFTGYVGGYGGVSKVKRFVDTLHERGIYPTIATEETYLGNLHHFRLKPDVVIDRGSSPEKDYEKVALALDDIGYETMISFGPRTFGPKHAIDSSKGVVIVDGGLPPHLGGTGTDHAHEVYQEIDGYALTCHFPWDIPQSIMDSYIGIPIEVRSQPIDSQTNERLKKYRNIGDRELGARRQHFFEQRGHSYRGQFVLPVHMSHSLFDEVNLEENGGWLKQSEYEQSIAFMSSLLSSLGESGEDVVVVMNSGVEEKFRGLINRCKNIHAVHASFFQPKEYLELLRIAHLNIDRAARNVTEFEIAASGSYVAVCPCPTEYMHEDISAEDAEQKGLVKHIPFNTPDIGNVLLGYIESDHYHDSREKRMETWDRIHEERDVADYALQPAESEVLYAIDV